MALHPPNETPYPLIVNLRPAPLPRQLQRPYLLLDLLVQGFLLEPLEVDDAVEERVPLLVRRARAPSGRLRLAIIVHYQYDNKPVSVALGNVGIVDQP